MLHRYARDKAKPITFPAANCPINKLLVITAPQLSLRLLSILGLVTLAAFFCCLMLLKQLHRCLFKPQVRRNGCNRRTKPGLPKPATRK